MGTMNESILADSRRWPAVEEVDLAKIEQQASSVSADIERRGYAFVVLEPDDGTRYELSIVYTPDQSAPFRFASSFGALYPWMGRPTIHPGYAVDHYVHDGSEWTATVYALFLNMVAERWQHEEGMG